MFEWELLAKLAEWLRAGRADRYADMIAKDQISEPDAFRDRLARASIAADWQAIATGSQRADEPYARQAWCIWTLEQSLATQEKRLARIAATDPAFADHVDLRDGIAALLHLQRSSTGMLLVDLRVPPEPMRDVA